MRETTSAFFNLKMLQRPMLCNDSKSNKHDCPIISNVNELCQLEHYDTHLRYDVTQTADVTKQLRSHACCSYIHT